MRSLTLLVPVFNESELIDAFLAKTVSDLADSELDWELLLIDDGSSDDSNQRIKDFASFRPNVSLITLDRNYGPGENYHQGFVMASKEYVAWATVDEFYDTRILKHLIKFTDDYSVISAYRTDLSSHTLFRRVQTVVNVIVMRILFPRYRFKAYHTLQIHRLDFIRSIEIESVTPFLCSELLFKAEEVGLKIKEVGIKYHPRKMGKATGGNPKLIFRHIAEMLKFWLRWVVLGKPLIDPALKDTLK